ncbi:DUF1275 domain-containing protein [Variovorax sp. VRV01]|uniref:YoaK family protein n=1 Tax=Variovorax sp. VRV01 TaxID=2769259 RepID=UPI00177F95E0|nr:YoaK family protein [Variovorax sp. VRV01]MBD9667326.1 DUF1275 domain-containing protein [Variovorax sp. VRV01]
MTSSPDRPDPTRALQIALIMSFVGGFLDAYSYVGWDGVFAGAQSVNIIVTAIAVAQGDWLAATRHLPSIAAFCMGVVSAGSLKTPRMASLSVRLDLAVLALEGTILLLIGILSPLLSASLATAVMAFAAGLQLTYFGHLHAWTYNSTMTTGNLRNLLEALTSITFNRNAAAKEQAIALSKAIAAFAVGGAVGGMATLQLHGRAICMAAPVLFVGICKLSGLSHRSSPTGTSA